MDIFGRNWQLSANSAWTAVAFISFFTLIAPLVTASGTEDEETAGAAVSVTSDAALAKGLRGRQVSSLVAENITDDGLGLIADHPEIKILQLRRASITATGFRRLSSLKGLVALDLADVKIGDEAMDVVGQFRDLLVLDLSRTRVTDVGLAKLGDLTALSALRLDLCRVSDAGVSKLTGLRNLHTLTLYGTEAGDGSVEFVARNSPITNLHLGRNTTDASIPWLAKLTDLEELGAVDTKITDDGLRRLAPKLTLTTLWVGGPHLSDAVLASFIHMPLESLSCYGIQRTPGGVAAIESFQNLAMLTLSRIPYQDNDLRMLGKLKGITYLRVDGTQVTDAFVPVIKLLPNLEQVIVRDTRISQEMQSLLMDIRK